jgi:hypothetical protein
MMFMRGRERSMLARVEQEMHRKCDELLIQCDIFCIRSLSYWIEMDLAACSGDVLGNVTVSNPFSAEALMSVSYDKPIFTLRLPS